MNWLIDWLVNWLIVCNLGTWCWVGWDCWEGEEAEQERHNAESQGWEQRFRIDLSIHQSHGSGPGDYSFIQSINYKGSVIIPL